MPTTAGQSGRIYSTSCASSESPIAPGLSEPMQVGRRYYAASGLYDLDGVVAVGNGGTASRLPGGLEGSVLHGRQRSSRRGQTEAGHRVAKKVHGVNEACFRGFDQDAERARIHRICAGAGDLGGIAGGAIDGIGTHVVGVIVGDININTPGIDRDCVGKIVRLERGLHSDQSSVELNEEPNHLIGRAISHVKKLARRIAGKCIGGNPDGERANGSESTRRAGLKRGKRSVTFVGYINVGIAGHYIDPYWIVAHRKERVVAIRDRGTRAARGAQLPGRVDGKDHQRPG